MHCRLVLTVPNVAGAAQSSEYLFVESWVLLVGAPEMLVMQFEDFAVLRR